MRHRTPLVVALVLVVGGLAALVPAQQTAASHENWVGDADDFDPGPVGDEYGSYEGVTYESKGEHNGHSTGFTLTEHGPLVVGSGGISTTYTAQQQVPVLNNQYRVGSNEPLAFVMEKPDGHQATLAIDLDYHGGQEILVPGEDNIWTTDLDMRLVGPDGTLDTSDTRWDGGFEAIRWGTTDGKLNDGNYRVDVWGIHGSSPIELSIEVSYVH